MALLIFGLVRPDDGSVPFFVLLALAAVGYLATLHQISSGLRPSGRALIACAGLALAWRVPMLLAPPEPGADLRRYIWDARVVRAQAHKILTTRALLPTHNRAAYKAMLKDFIVVANLLQPGPGYGTTPQDDTAWYAALAASIAAG